MRIPVNRAVHAAHHAVRRTTTLAGNVRFDAERSASIGHADHFWAHMLAIQSVQGGRISYGSPCTKSAVQAGGRTPQT